MSSTGNRASFGEVGPLNDSDAKTVRIDKEVLAAGHNWGHRARSRWGASPIPGMAIVVWLVDNRCAIAPATCRV